MTTDYQTNQILKNQSLSDLRDFLKENKAEKGLLVSLDFLEEYILNLECDIELNTNLAEEENKPIQEIIHHDEE